MIPRPAPCSEIGVAFVRTYMDVSSDDGPCRGYVHAACSRVNGRYWDAKRTLRKLQRLLMDRSARQGCDPVQPFRTMSPPNLRLKSGGPSRVRRATLVWLLLRQ